MHSNDKAQEYSDTCLFIVADIKSSPILDLKTSSNLNLIKRVMKVDSHAQDYFESYGDCFGELGTL